MEFVDTHCHLQFDKLAAQLDKVIDDAGIAGVKRLVCVGTSLKDSQTALDIAAQHKNVWAAVGAHPHAAKDFLNQPQHLKILNKLSILPKVVAIGEIGLDFYKNYSPKETQAAALRRQIEVGLAIGLPFIFHIRDAWDDFWPIFDEYKNLRGVVHSFSSGPKQLAAALGRGLYIGLNGIMTFTKDEAQLVAARQVPLERLVLETDAPFLAPAAVRGQICQPKHVVATAEFLTELRGESIAELSKATADNAVRLFKLGNRQ